MSSSDVDAVVEAKRRAWVAKARLKSALPWMVWAAAIATIASSWQAAYRSGVAPAEAIARRVAVAAPAAAVVVATKVAPGAKVAAGDVLVVLDDARAASDLAIAEEEARRLRLLVDAKAKDLKGSDLEAQNRLAAESEGAALDVARLRSEQSRDEAELAQLDASIERAQQLVEQKLRSVDDLEELRVRRAALARRVAEAPALLDAAQRRAAATTARLTTWRAQGGGPTTASDEAAAKAGELRVLQLRAAKDALTIRAPRAGVVEEVPAAPGDAVAAGAIVVRLVDESATEAVVWADEVAGAGVAVGGRVLLRPSDGVGEPVRGTVTSLGPSVVDAPARFQLIKDETRRARPVYVRLDDGARALPGRTYDAAFAGAP